MQVQRLSNRRPTRGVPGATGVLLLLAYVSCRDLGEVEHRPPDAPSSEPAPRSVIDTSSDPAGFGPETESSPSPPPLSGGTMIVSKDGRRVVVADPDRDRVWIVDVGTREGVGSITLAPGSEPARLIEDDEGRVHVALRGKGVVATLSLDRSELLFEREVCANTRGLAFDAATQQVHVACLNGDLVTLPAGGGDEVRRLNLGGDLRDLVVDGAKLWVSRFRSAEVLMLDPQGSVVSTFQLPIFRDIARDMKFVPTVAWRMIARPGGGVLVLHQRASTHELSTRRSGAYGGGSTCLSNTVHSTITMISENGFVDTPPPYEGLVLSVDIAVSPDGSRIAVASPGNAGKRSQASTILAVDLSRAAPSSCATSTPFAAQDPSSLGEITSIAYVPAGDVVLFSREPAAIHFLSSTPGKNLRLTLGGEPRAHFGHAAFHRDAGAGVACASCHPEGGEDGRVWRFTEVGARRTQSLRGGIIGTEPFHWDGDLRDLEHLLDEVMRRRMGGPALSTTQVTSMEHWLASMPAFGSSEPRDVTAAARGRTLFRNPAVGCETCHAGPMHTNHGTFDVGTGGPFQVPSLTGLRHRAPYLHNGCASTISDRFGACGGGDRHGVTSHLSAAELADLVSYLDTL